MLYATAKCRARDWYKQAENDFLRAKDSLKAGRFAQVCFICQQIADKAVKALAFHREFDQVRGHSVTELVKALDIDGELLKAAKRLDQYYISTCYPDAFPTGAPFEFFTEEQAREAVNFAELFFERRKIGVRLMKDGCLKKTNL
ncbi:MAG: HEPN domain-containing protein [Deltaproteobacteria bacterium]|nr:HEPN domain-containing protein [Deltaproteobacteria bacterium]